MEKTIIRLTESDLHNIIKEAVNTILTEGHNGHTKGSGVEFRKVYKILKKNGCVIIRENGDHVMFRTKDGAMFTLTRPYINAMIWRRICKENNIDTSL